MWSWGDMKRWLVLGLCVSLVAGLPDQARRRRIKKKIVRTEEEGPEAAGQEEPPATTKDKTGRG